MQPSFSVVIPTFNRSKDCLRAIDSVLRQTYDGPFEVVVVNDGSTDDTSEMLALLCDADARLNCVVHEVNQGKVAARNSGMAAAKNDWVVWLDSDDELYSAYLENVADHIVKNPEVRIFTCGALVFNDKTHSFHFRDTFAPKAGEQFKSGKIGTGSFIFRREDYISLPESKEAYGGPESFSALVQKAVPEIAALYGQNEAGSYHPLGNPFGDDYVAFFLLTRKNDAFPVQAPYYIQHVRN